MIGQQLEEEGIIRNGMMFEYFLKLNSITDYHSGEYELSPSMDFQQIAKTLETGRLYQEVLYRLTVPEGYSVEEIAAQAEDQLPVAADRFMELMEEDRKSTRLNSSHVAISY